MGTFNFFNGNAASDVELNPKRKHKMLIVDDDQSIHEITRLAINSIDLVDVELEVLTAYSAEEAKEILNREKDISLALLDVVMETPEAGLDLVSYIRQEQNDNMIRLIMRTGQANRFPPIEVVQKYDINDFKEKTELTIEKLFITIRSSIKQYEQLEKIKTKYRETYQQLVTNSLTKAPNRIALTDRLEKLTDEHALVLIDIVGFSMINESNGFESGDEFLVAFCEFLKKYESQDYEVFHLNGDQFALLINLSHNKLPRDQIKAIYQEVISHYFTFSQFRRKVLVRVGVATGDDREILRSAELALKESKSSYVNPLSYFSPDLDIIKTIDRNAFWTPIVRQAIEKEGFIAYYQPIINFDTGQIDKHESLVRLNHNGTIYTPDKFLCVAKYNGLLHEIFSFMFADACRQAAIHQSSFSVNILATDFTSDGLVEFIHETLAKYNTDPKHITLEILEDISINRDSHIRNKILEIRALGISIAIDDFGVNCSNFGQLDSLPIDFIKIDGSFIKNIVECKNSQIVTKTIKTYAQEKNIKLIAEFIHSQEVYDFVKDFDIGYGQGYFIGEPRDEAVDNHQDRLKKGA